MVARVLIIAAVLAAGCEKRSTLYCGKNPEDLANCEQTDAPPPEPVACMTDAQCTPGQCELGAHVCVECLDNAHCTTDERCDIGGTYTCRGCIVDDDCPGGTCLPSGSCGGDSKVVYVAAGGSDTGTCTSAAPCATIEYALPYVSKARSYLRLSGDLTENVVLDTVEVDILATGATLTATANGAVISIVESIVSVTGLTIACAADQDGIETGMSSTLTLQEVEIANCTHDAAVDLHGGFTKIERSNIHDSPTALGIKTDGSAVVSITNNWIHHHALGGIKLGNDVTEGQRIEFNTIVDNGLFGVSCKTEFPTPNNIAASNGVALDTNFVVCTSEGSLVDIEVAAMMFASPDAAPYDYHIGATSMAKDAATVQSVITVDYDRDIRPQGTASDVGADEYRAP